LSENRRNVLFALRIKRKVDIYEENSEEIKQFSLFFMNSF